jgi:WD40 repeat protein
MVDSQDVDNQESLEVLVRAITFSLGEFSLILVRCNYAHLRQQFVQRLREQCPIKIRELVLDESIKTLYTTIKTALQGEKPDALMVLGLELVNDIDRVIVATNQVREEFRKNFPFPIVLWVNDEVLTKFIRLAPDFDSWTTTIEFAIATDELIDTLNQTADDAFSQILNVGAGRFLDNAVLNLAIDSHRRSEIKLALQDLHNRVQELDPALEANIQFLLGRDAQANNQMEKARQHYEQSLAFWQQNENLERHGCLLFYLGLWWRRYAVLHRLEYLQSCRLAKDYFQQCVAVFQQGKRPDLAARFINALGEVLTRLEDWDELEVVAKTSLDLYQSYGNSSQHLYSGYAYGLLAEVALNKAAWSEAKNYAELALQKNAEPAVAALGSQYADTNWGWAWKQYQSFYLLLLAKSQYPLNQREAAVRNLEKAREESNPQYDPQLYIKILGELRSLYFQQGEYLKAFEVKQEQQSIEAQYGFRPFTGAGSLRPVKRIINPAFDPIDAQERARERMTATGRRSDLNNIIQRLSRNDYKLIVIHGMSGVGKSSLIWAGLEPELKENPIGDRTALPITLRYYTNWARELEQQLRLAGNKRGVRETPEPIDICVESIETTSEKGKYSIEKIIIERLKKCADRNLLTVLIFDQFEEFFFACTNLVERRPFYEFLGACLNLPYVKVILSLREDYLHYLLECDRFAKLDVINNNILDKNIRYYLGDFSLERAKSVIRELTDRSQFYLEPALVDELVRDLAGELGEIRPIELQVVGAQLQTENITTLEQYHQLGANPKEKLVQRSLEEVIKDCGTENERAARLVLYLLTNENGTRPLKTRAELEADLQVLGFESETEQLDLVLEILVGSGLVFLVPDSPANRYQLVHDYLVAFIRQQQAPGLLAELAEAKEKQKLTEAQLREALREKEEALRKEQEERKRAEIAEIEALSSLSQALLLSHDHLEALIAGVKAGRKLKEVKAPSDIQHRTVDRLRQIVNRVRERNRFQGHNDCVTSVSFSPDGKTIASASDDNTIKLWSLDGKELNTFHGHSGTVWSVNFSPDGQTIASASEDNTVKLWSLDGTELHTFYGHSSMVWSVSFSPDGQMIASTSEDNTVKLWSLDGREMSTFQGHDRAIWSASFSPDGQMIASASDDNTVKLWSLDGRELQTFYRHSGRLWSVSFSPDGQALLFTGENKMMKLWSLDGRELQTFQGHATRVWSVSFSPDGRMIASAGDDNAVKLWSLDGREIHTFQGHSSWVWSVKFSPDGQTLISGSEDTTVRLWSLDNTELRSFRAHDFDVNSVSFSPDGRILASVGADNTVKLWSLDGRELQTLRGHQAEVRAVSFSPNGQMLVSSGFDGLVRLWDIDGGELQTFQGHNGKVWSVSFSPDGQTIASASEDNTIKLWNLDGRELHTFQGHTSWVRSVSFSPDGQTMASASGDNTVKLWSLDGRKIQTLQGHHSAVMDVSFSPDAQMIASASRDKTVKLWSLDGRELHTFPGRTGELRSVRFSPDGQTIAFGGEDNTVTLWSIDGRELQTFGGHQARVKSLSFSPNGRILASASDDGTVRLWKLDCSNWNLDLDELLVRGCNWLRDYLKTNPNVRECDRTLCDDICTQT